MTKLTIALLVGTLILGGLHVAAADESKADCEKNVEWYDANGVKHDDPQPWAGYKDTDPVRSLFYQADASEGNPVYFNNCEGEQWDGQDSVSTYHATDDPCQPDVNPDATHPAVVQCMGVDPNTGSSNPLGGATIPVRLRLTGDNEGSTSQQYYLGVQIGAVGWAVIYLGECNGGSGLEGEASCEHGHDAREGVYLRDDSPGNPLATVVSSLGLTKGYVSEGDCSEATYMKGAEEGNRRECGRDNTALGADEGTDALNALA